MDRVTATGMKDTWDWTALNDRPGRRAQAVRTAAGGTVRVSR